MPGYLLNRLSRPKPGETPTEQLRKGRAILLEQMLPTIHPDAQEGHDYIYLEDIESRLNVHQEGEILHRVLTALKQGQCQWIAVTEVARLTGDLETAGQLLTLCRSRQVPIYTFANLRYPYQPWIAESNQQLMFGLFQAAYEVETYRGRIQRNLSVFYPVDPETGISKMNSEGLGRHLNGQVPPGYVWNKLTKLPEPDLRVPCPDYLPPGAAAPPAFTMWDIVKRLRALGRTLGVNEACYVLRCETGFTFPRNKALYAWRNPFYAGRPTMRHKEENGKLVKRPKAEWLSTTGRYPPMETWPEFCELQSAIDARQQDGQKTNSTAWASGIFRCECGEPLISKGKVYVCRSYMRDVAWIADRDLFAAGKINQRRFKERPVWERTPTCGNVSSRALHAYLEQELRGVFARSDVAARIARWQHSLSARRESSAALREQMQAIDEERARIARERERLINFALKEVITEADLAARLPALEKERQGLETRKTRIQEQLAQPDIAPASIRLVLSILETDFEWIWDDPDILTPQDKRLIVHTLFAAIPVRGKGPERVFGPVQYQGWEQAALEEDG